MTTTNQRTIEEIQREELAALEAEYFASVREAAEREQKERSRRYALKQKQERDQLRNLIESGERERNSHGTLILAILVGGILTMLFGVGYH